METAVLAYYGNRDGLTQQNAVRAANARGARLCSNGVFDKMILFSSTRGLDKDIFPAWTGTAVAFKGEGAKLGDVVKYTDPKTGISYIFPVPKEYQNETNAILAVNHDFLPDGRPAFSFQQDGRDILIEVADNSRIALLRNFPGQNGWYLAENEFRIPIRTDTKGMPCSIPPKPEGPFVRHLHREAKGGGAGGYAGLLGRNGYRSFNRHVLAAAEPSSPFGALLDSEGIAKAGLRQSGSQ